MGRKSIIKKLPDHIIEELTSRIYSGKYTQVELKDWLGTQGYDVGTSSMGRYCLKVQHDLSGLGFVGISQEQYQAHQKEIDEINRLAGLKTLIEIRLNKLHQIVLEDV